MTAWQVIRCPKTPGVTTLLCRCGECGKPAAVVIRTDTLLRLARDPGMPLGKLAGAHTLRTGNHKECDERTAA